MDQDTELLVASRALSNEPRTVPHVSNNRLFLALIASWKCQRVSLSNSFRDIAEEFSFVFLLITESH